MSDNRYYVNQAAETCINSGLFDRLDLCSVVVRARARWHWLYDWYTYGLICCYPLSDQGVGWGALANAHEYYIQGDPHPVEKFLKNLNRCGKFTAPHEISKYLRYFGGEDMV